MDDLNEAGGRHRSIPRGRPARVALAMALVLLAALVALWLTRKPIAAHYIDRTFARAGVPAHYAIADLGFGRQRLTNVVIGDPADPDLVADWLETETSVGLSGAAVTGVRAGHVRMRGRLADGKLSLGALDRLMLPSSGKPFALPRLALDVADGRMRLATSYGLVGLKLNGAGRLDDGFRGHLAAVSDRLAAGGCVVSRASAAVRVTTAGGRPSLTGPVGAATLACGTTRIAGIGADVAVDLGAALTAATGQARVAAVRATLPGAALEGVGGTVRFAAQPNAVRTSVALTAARFAAGDAAGRGLGLAGDLDYARGALAFGSVGGMQATAAEVHGSRARLAGIARAIPAAAGTPLAPLLAGATDAATRAAASFALTATIRGGSAAGATRIGVTGAQLHAASGARLVLADGAGVEWRSVGPLRLAGTVAMRGGGLPSGTIRLDQRAAGAPVTGIARFDPYAAGGARLALGDIAFAATPHGNIRARTRIDLSGPLGDGRIDHLVVPVDALWDGRGRLAVGTDCTPLSVQHLAVSGLTLDPTRLALCPTGAALVTLDRGRLGGGARLAAARLTGRLGSTPLTLAAAGAELGLGTRGFTMRGLQARLGSPDRVTRLDFASVTGGLDRSGLAGTFAGGAGQIANVPLLLGDGAGGWRLRGGALALTGTLGVSDAQAAAPRFKPLLARDVALRLAGGGIVATGVLREPRTGTRIADLRIEHALGPGTGHADLAVPGLTFAKAFQPELLTPLTLGVIADVAGTISGQARIGWSPAGVTSTGTFRTAGTDLAAAFGPVTGIAGEIRFTDLLALRSAPGQVATVRAINPGIVVGDGRIVYQTLPDTQVRIEEGRWPFAGGTLTLEPTLLDFAEARERRMTFRVRGAATDQFLQQFDFKNLNATGVFDGTLPMVFDTAGGRIENGRLAVRPGGGSLAYVGDLSAKDMGFWANLAFGALKSLRYRNLTIVMNGPLAGEMVTEVRFAGISQGEGATSNFLIRRLQKLPFVFNIRIAAPFRGLLDSAQSFYDPSRLIQRNLPGLLDAQQRAAPAPVQPPASEIVP